MFIRTNKPLLLVLGVFLYLVLPSKASADTITFENFADLTPITNQISGMVFTNATVAAAGVSLNEFEFPPHSGSNVIFDGGGPISITFANPILSFSGYFTYGTRLTLTAFDPLNNQVALNMSAFSNNLALSGDPGSIPNEFLVVSSSFSISRITIAGGPSGTSFTLDDMTINSSATVPEPSTILLFLTGSAALLGYRNRRST